MIPGATGERREPNGTVAFEGQGLDTTASEVSAKRHFDAFETDFFQQGDDSANLSDDRYPLDDVDARGRSGQPLLSRASLLGLTVVSSGLALVACAALWHALAPVAAPPSAAAPRAWAPSAGSTAIPLGAVSIPASNPGTAAQDALPVEPLRSDSVASGEAEPTATVAEKTTPSTVGRHPTAVTVAEEATTPSSGLAAESTNGVLPQNGGVAERCKQSIRKQRNRRILALCPAAFAEDGSDTNVAIALAKAELDRGRFAQASFWSQKALAINPGLAEAYVFAGGAEQNQGHNKAAKQAYLHYLRLAPSGRYAAELRTIVGSL